MKKINKKLYKESLSKFATGIVVVGINLDGIFLGKTVNSFSAVSLDPPLILFSLDRQASSLNKYKKIKYLSINILSNKQKNISKIFSNKNLKWEKAPFKLSKYKTPIIKNCLSNLECEKIKVLLQGDHFIFICKVLNSSYNKNLKPLLYFNSKYINK
tara:strand:- start:102 stop:572 length:471 start_codon:yes stop_codon:yes gene_type:complete